MEVLLEMTVAEETDSEIEEPQQTQLLSEPPLLLLGGHNSIRFTGQLKFVGEVSSGFSGNRVHLGFPRSCDRAIAVARS